MFTGIVEEVGEVVAMSATGTNVELWVRARMAPELRIDQSVAHNGVCLTVVELQSDRFRVTAVEETLQRTTLGTLTSGAPINLERCLRLGDRLDGHMVQGHVDTTVPCLARTDRDGSTWFDLAMPPDPELLVEKGSITLNGVSLTIAALQADRFSVTIIPYTLAHTTFGTLRAGDPVNVEYDVLGKYVRRMLVR